MWPPPLSVSVELPMGPRSVVLGVADAGGHPHRGLRWSSYGATAVLSVAGACGTPHWAFRWNSRWGHETPYWVWRTHV
eukprot:7777625-Pyramimonas_sp.AAC.1